MYLIMPAQTPEISRDSDVQRGNPYSFKFPKGLSILINRTRLKAVLLQITIIFQALHLKRVTSIFITLAEHMRLFTQKPIDPLPRHLQ